MASHSHAGERRAATIIVVAALALIAIGTTWERARGSNAGTERATTVLAHVPARGSDVRAIESARLRQILRESPRNLGVAVRLARLDIAAARELADPRFLGRAEAALSPWWNDRDAPAEALLLRATIRQARHEFDAALADLEDLVTRPRTTVASTVLAQALLTRAVVLGVKARYADALASCGQLAGLASPFVQAACGAPVLGVTGRAPDAAVELAGFLGTASGVAEVAWGRSLLADLALWSGDEHGAETLLRSVLAIAPHDGIARATLADLLIDMGRPSEAGMLVAGHEEDDALLLRLALARAAESTAGSHDGVAATMAARFDASRLRGDVVHRREEARFALVIERNPVRALRLAEDNWSVQQEPADARVLLEAALAAHAPGVARPALDWLDKTGLTWPRLRALAAALRSAS
jgi:tetratricopeptide (TPR) repeat protein